MRFDYGCVRRVFLFSVFEAFLTPLKNLTEWRQKLKDLKKLVFVTQKRDSERRKERS